MSQTMLSPFANILVYAGGPITVSGNALFALAIVGIILVVICFNVLKEWIRRRSGHKWPTVSAVVDIVNVAFMKDESPLPRLNTNLNLPYYLVTLTYTYRNPEEQMGDYSRRFGDKVEAEAWANSYKGETVKVHVDPRDPTRSVLREEDL